MKITIITKECKTKDKDAPAKANLCFRLRDKDVDLKVRSDIEVMLDYWDNDALSYRRTRNYHLTSRRKSRLWCRPLQRLLASSITLRLLMLHG